MMKEQKGSEMLGVIEQFADQIEEAYNLPKELKVLEEFNSIVVAGMGGSAIPGDLLKAYVGNIPVFVNKDYELPEFVNSMTLVFVISYSGNTEETLTAFRVAIRKNAKIVGITSGGKLRELCERNTKPCIIVPAGLQPRAGLAYLFFPMLRILSNSNITDDQAEEVKKTVKALSVPWFKERAEALAEKIQGHVPLIYASERFGAVAYRWKTQFNENSKIHAFANTFPELDHNEIVGYTKLNARYYTIILQDEDDEKRIKDRMRITKNLIADNNVKTTEIVMKGSSFLAKLFSAIHLGDLTSYYLAIKTGIDPTPVEVVEELKRRLG